MQIFARITKVDEAQRRVTGIAASETVDKTNEMLDYDLSKVYFTDWSEGIAKATEGKSVGNLRVMHGSTVAGKLVEMGCDDVSKSFPITAEIVDDNEWNKVLKGCYTGFSIGGSYVSKSAKDEAGIVSYVAKPTEVSLVDLPCNPEATFTVSKADGVEELRKFAPAPLTKRHAFAEVLAKRDDIAPVLLALSQLIDKPLQKGMYAVSELADLLCSLGWLAEDSEWEEQMEGDDSTVPAQLRDAVKSLAQILIQMANEETKELAARLGNSTTKLTPPGDLHKGATSPKEDDMDLALQKSLDTANADLAKAISERDELQKALTTANAGIAERDEVLLKAATALDERNDLIKKLEAMPEPIKVAMRAVAKSDDVTVEEGKSDDKVLKSDGTVDEGLTALRKALNQPVTVR
ncbi:MAG: hypothetical protein ACREPQ_09655 [Rhodanobacter sp.]